VSIMLVKRAFGSSRLLDTTVGRTTVPFPQREGTMRRLLTVAQDWSVAGRAAWLAAIHVVLIAAASLLAFWLRGDGRLSPASLAMFQQTLPLHLFLQVVAFASCGVYQGLWRYTGLWELERIVAAVGLGSLSNYLLIRSFLSPDYPYSVAMIDAILLVLFVGGIRLIGPIVAHLRSAKAQKRVLIVGAGDAGEAMVRELLRRGLREPVGFVDDDRRKAGYRIHGVPVLGTRTDLPALINAHRPEEVLIAVPSATPRLIREIVEALRPFSVAITRLPAAQDIHQGTPVTTARRVSIEDLLARPTADLDNRPIRQLIEGRTVMVTGAGGSIGSELCRQIATLRPSALVLYERYENNLFAIATELLERHTDGRIHPVIGDVTDVSRLEDVMAEHRPALVFHAAAHKHVPLMEFNVCEAVKNNVIGSRLVMEAAERHRVDRFILISSDKAVNPTSVMGTTKRVAERILQLRAASSTTGFSTVRFGNVLGSNGSVVPRFLDQIQAGGPVTITHPDIRRYFMSIPEAVCLVLHAAAQRKSGLSYVLEMGEQVKLVELAKNLIRLSGFTPDEIAISFIGLRPGEKLFEELVGPDELARPSGTARILEVVPRVLPDRMTLTRQVADLERLALSGAGDHVMAQLREIVPGFKPSDDERGPAVSESIKAEKVAPVETAVTGHVCARCGSSRLNRSRHRSFVDSIRRSLTRKRPYRCLACGWKGWVLPGPGPRAADVVRMRRADVPDLSLVDRALGVAVPSRE